MIKLNTDGYLTDPNTWNEIVAKELAQQEALTLTEHHWHILNALKQFYNRYAMVPTMRAFLEYLKQ